MVARLERSATNAIRSKLPADSFAALRKLTRILGQQPAAVSRFFRASSDGPAPTRPASLGRRLKTRTARLRANNPQ